jgi:hypothetical protein
MDAGASTLGSGHDHPGPCKDLKASQCQLVIGYNRGRNPVAALYRVNTKVLWELGQASEPSSWRSGDPARLVA